MSEKVTINVGGKEIELDVNNLDQEQFKENMQEKHEEQWAEQGKLPDIKTIFSIGNQLFIITFINPGNKRISCEWYNDKSAPFNGLPEIDSNCTIHGKMYSVVYINETKRRINIEPIND